MKPVYDLDKLKYGTDAGTFSRAVGLYKKDKVTQVECAVGSYTAIVQGTEPYRVSVAARSFKQGHCTCYLGQQGTLCKHMVALALHAVQEGKPLATETTKTSVKAECSLRAGQLNSVELEKAKIEITNAMKYIKPYRGPSKTWFANQDSLCEGCARLNDIVHGFPVSKQTSDILINLLLRLDKKLCTGGVDDSNGTVGGFMTEVVAMLEKYAKIDSDCVGSFKKLTELDGTCFGWESELVRLFDEQKIT